MQKKIALLVCVMTWFIAVKQAVAQGPYAMGNKLELTSADGNFRIGFRGNLQENNKLKYKRDEINFEMEIKRARIVMQGHAFDPALTYLIQLGFEKPYTKNEYPGLGSDVLKDYYLNIAFHEKYAQLRVGKFLTPLSREYMMSNTFEIDSASRWFASAVKRNDSRDVGLMLHNTHHHPLEWALAAASSGLYGRIGYNHNHIDGYDPVDWHRGGLRFAVANSSFLHFDYKSAKFEDFRNGTDFIVKIAGFKAYGAFYWRLARELVKDKIEAKHGLGVSVNLGYLINSMLEPVLHYSWHKGADPAKNGQEFLGGLNYFAYGHHLKVQGYGGADFIEDEKPNWKIGVQLQFAL